MSDDDDDDLFADSGGDTDDLIAESKAKPIAKPKTLTKGGSKKRKIDAPDADNDSDDEGGLFDSDDEDEKPAAKAPPKKPLSKRERMEALRKKKRAESGIVDQPPRKKARDSSSGNKDGEKDGYGSETSMDSAEYVRTKEDNDFIDTEGDDADALAELYAEQHFDREEAEEERPKKKKISGAGSSRGRSERAELEAEADEDNPIMQAVNKMKRKKKVVKRVTELETEAAELIERMEKAANDDDESVAQKRPATKKLSMLSEVCEMLAKRDMFRPLLDLKILHVCKHWIQPLRSGKLGNVTVRSRIVDSIALMNGDGGINKHDLTDSGIGKVIMSLYMHKDETREMKKKLKKLIEAWSRPIFQKSGNMRDLKNVQHARGEGGLSAIARQNQSQMTSPVNMPSRSAGDQDITSLIKSGTKGKGSAGINRVRVPFSKGFQFSVQPSNKTTGDIDKRRATAMAAKDARGNLAKRMVEKGRTVSKNQRSANISIEGRAAK